eukprot:scaffold73360_cov61-Cyclotella_meneghiniana.AAC.9
MECYVLGSKWQVEEDRYDGMIPTMLPEGREPMYAVLLNGEPSFIPLTSAHEGEDGDWMVDTTKKRVKMGNGTIINERFDMLARLNGSHHTNKDDDTDEKEVKVDELSDDDYDSKPRSLEVLNARIHRALKSINTAEKLDTWGREVHDKFLKDFLSYCFTPYEQSVIMQRDATSKERDNSSIEESIKSFPSSLGRDRQTDNNFCARVALAKMAIYHLKENLGGVILTNQRGTKFQAIEFNGNCTSQGVPCIDIHYAVDPEGIDRTMDYLRGETYEVMEEENSVAVCLEENILNSVRNEGLNDVGSGLLFYQGYLAPLVLIPLCESKSPINVAQPTAMPDVNFGVELEMSCASGNQVDNTISNLATHGVEVKTRLNQGKGKSGFGFWPYSYASKDKSDSDSDHFDEDDSSSCSSHSSMPDLDPVSAYQTGSDDFKSSDSNNKKAASKHAKWSICYDKSIKPNEDNPLSSLMELVSPILTGETGLRDLDDTLQIVSDIVCVRLNKSMGLHVHVETKESDYSLESMISICQQFILYEEVIDKFLLGSRRSGSEQSHSYFKSNRLSIMSRSDTFKGALERLASCKSREQLYGEMNPGDRARYHKLNLQNLRSKRQPTIEFRQHHASKDSTEVKAWVRFCVLFTTNSSRLKPLRKRTSNSSTGWSKGFLNDTKPKKKSRTKQNGSNSIPDADDVTFDTLFDEIIGCPVLREYYSIHK